MPSPAGPGLPRAAPSVNSRSTLAATLRRRPGAGRSCRRPAGPRGLQVGLEARDLLVQPLLLLQQDHLVLFFFGQRRLQVLDFAAEPHQLTRVVDAAAHQLPFTGLEASPPGLGLSLAAEDAQVD